MPDMTRILRSRVVLAGLVAVSFVYLLIGFDRGLNVYDEGLAVTGAMRVLDGDVPYRDFWTIYAPGQFYALAGLFAVLGPSLGVERVFSVAMLCAAAFAVFLVARRLMPAPFALVAWVVAVVWAYWFGSLGSPVPATLLLVLLGCLCLLDFFSNAGRRWAFAGGACLGAAALFRHDIAAVVAVAELAVLLVFTWQRRTSRGSGARARLGGLVRQGPGHYLLGVALVVVPVAAYFLAVVPVSDLVDDLIVFPLTVFPKVRALPYPGPVPELAPLFSGEVSPLAWVEDAVKFHLPFYFPLMVYVAASVWIVLCAARRTFRWDTCEPWALVLIVLVGLALHNQGLVRTHTSHLVPTYFAAAVLFAAMLHRLFAGWRRRPVVYGALILVLALAGVSAVALPAYSRVLTAARRLAAPAGTAFTVDRARGIRAEGPVAECEEAIRVIRAGVPPGQSIYVGNLRHDRVLVADAMFYFLAGRPCATKFHELHPGLTTTAEVQQAIVRDLDARGVRWVVLVDFDRDVFGWTWAEEPNESARSSGVTLLDDHIRARFEKVRDLGPYSVWHRKD